ncbi:MAG: sigma-70 family RNA polymerase sigma factor [Pirellulaceae bacterium]
MDSSTLPQRDTAPETRMSLLVRMQGGADHAAWTEFVGIYSPVIYRAARYKGLQDADAQDVTQQVLLAVARSLERRPHDPHRAKFRTWLGRVTRNAALNALQRVKPDRATGDSDVHASLKSVADSPSDELLLEREYQKQLFRAAAEIVQPEFAADTWRAFWLTTVEGQELGDVAELLNKNLGSIYAARSRVMRRLREQVQAMQAAE